MDVVVEVEEALGPGVEFEVEADSRLVGRRVRAGGLWLGFDRAALVDSDDGGGRRLAVLVASPTSTFAGARLVAELQGGWRSERGTVLLARIRGAARPLPELARIAAGVEPPASFLSADEAGRQALLAHQRFRERRSRVRIRGGRAWQAHGPLPPEIARFATPHSEAEYSLSRVPAQFMRGLADLLDDDERVIYWVQRPQLTDPGLAQRIRRIDRRAALLLMTDRQLLWLVDHAQPDAYLSDWGADVDLVPLERLTNVSCQSGAETVELSVETPAGRRAFTLPVELRDEVAVMRDLLTRFTPPAADSRPRRRYELIPIEFDAEAADRFGQLQDAQRLYASAAAGGPVLAFLYSPRRAGQRKPTALAVRESKVDLLADQSKGTPLSAVASIALTLSPLVGRISFGDGVGLSYPAPLIDRGAALVRLTRRALANT